MSLHWEMKTLKTIYIIVAAWMVAACQQKAPTQASKEEDNESKRLLQGVWIDDETQEVNFKIKGDTIFYPDSTSQPACFKVIDDSLVVGEPPSRYPIVKLTANIFVFKNQNGEELKLTKSDSPDDNAAFERRSTMVAVVSEVLKRDTVVTFSDEHYHCYVTVNPTRFKVLRRSYNDDGVAVDNVFYDNIIHVSVYHGCDKLYSSDISKKMYGSHVPADFLSQSILGDIRFTRIDKEGFHFETIIGVPEETTSYILDTVVSFEGKVRITEIK